MRVRGTVIGWRNAGGSETSVKKLVVRMDKRGLNGDLCDLCEEGECI